MVPLARRHTSLAGSGSLARLPGLAGRLVRDHPVLAAVLGVGLVLRVAYWLAYPHAFMFPDSRGYLQYAHSWGLSTLRPYGYSFFLKLLGGVPDLAILVQHAMGLALAVLGYVFLTTRGVRRWVAGLAVAPVVLGPIQLTLEHYVLSEQVFTVATATALVLLTWPRRLSVWAAFVGSGLLVYAALTRFVGLPMCLLAGGYLLVRRVGWRALVAYAVPVVIGLGGYVVAYHHQHGVYAFSQYQGRFLFARTMTVANCRTLDITDEQRALCLEGEWIRDTGRIDHYIWAPASPVRIKYPSVKDDPFLGDFARAVITQQPGDYALMVARETAWHLMPDPPLAHELRCYRIIWLPPDPTVQGCLPNDLVNSPGGPVPALTPTLRTSLVAYGKVDSVMPPLMGGMLLLTLVGVALRARPGRWRDAGDGLFIAGAGLALLVGSVATSSFESRYAMPVSFLFPAGAALALLRRPGRPGADAGPDHPGTRWLRSGARLVGAQAHGDEHGTDDQVKAVVGPVERDDVQRAVAGDEQTEYAQRQVHGADQRVRQPGGPHAGDGRGDHGGAHREVDDVVQRVDLEQAEELTARVPGQVVTARHRKAEQADHDEDRADRASDE